MTAVFSALQNQGIWRLLFYWATGLAFDRYCIFLHARALDFSRIHNVRFWTSCLWHQMFLYLCNVISSRHATFSSIKEPRRPSQYLETKRGHSFGILKPSQVKSWYVDTDHHRTLAGYQSNLDCVCIHQAI